MVNNNEERNSESLVDDKGQSFVEFILLLAGISIVSFAFMKNLNGNIATKWKIMAEVIYNNGADTESPDFKRLELR